MLRLGQVLTVLVQRLHPADALRLVEHHLDRVAALRYVMDKDSGLVEDERAYFFEAANDIRIRNVVIAAGLDRHARRSR